jgi:hypothetical protein
MPVLTVVERAIALSIIIERLQSKIRRECLTKANDCLTQIPKIGSLGVRLYPCVPVNGLDLALSCARTVHD